MFGLVERRAAEPILPGWVLRRRLFATTSLASLGVGAMLIGLTSYVPLFAQSVLGTSALVAGFALAALTIGWPIAATTAGRIYLRIGFRATALLGCSIVLVGAVLLAFLDRDSSVWQVAATCLVIGLGMGWVASPTLIAAQSSVEWAERGVVTGTNMFARSMGSALGIAVFGALVNAAVGRAGTAGAPRHHRRRAAAGRAGDRAAPRLPGRGGGRRGHDGRRRADAPPGGQRALSSTLGGWRELRHQRHHVGDRVDARASAGRGSVRSAPGSSTRSAPGSSAGRPPDRR